MAACRIGDNSLGAFVQSLADAMSATLPERAARPGLPDFEAVGSPQGFAADLIERLSLAEAEIALFLDDLEILVADAARAFLQRFVEEFDARHRLILACRNTPGLALARIRAQGEAVEICQTICASAPKRPTPISNAKALAHRPR